MRFRVTNQYGKGPEDVLAEFKTQLDAELFIKTKVQQDAMMKISVMYRLYDSLDLIKEFDTSSQTASDEDSGSSGGQGKQASFRPTPLNTTPSPRGLPKNWWKEEDDEEEKK